jgi:hypothetical protein
VISIRPVIIHIQIYVLPYRNAGFTREDHRGPSVAAIKVKIEVPPGIEVNIRVGIIVVAVFCPIPMCGSPGRRTRFGRRIYIGAGRVPTERVHPTLSDHTTIANKNINAQTTFRIVNPLYGQRSINHLRS